MSKPLLSIIVPVFRAEKSIEKLVESLEQQSFKDYELILVNDITPNEEHTILTTEIIKKLEEKYDNIVRVDMPHTRYQGHARNEGLKYAQADYITFADSDDWYAPNFFEVIVPEIKKNDFELLFFNAYTMNYDKFICYLLDKPSKEIFIEEKGFQKFLHGIFAHQVGNSPWNKIFLKSVIDKYDIKNEFEKKTCEDLLFNLEYFGAIKKYHYVNKPLYYYQLNMDVVKTNVYRPYNLEEEKKFNKAIDRIAKKYEFNDYYRWLGLFLLRHFPGQILNESSNDNYEQAKEHIKLYLTEEENKKAFKNIKIKDFDFKLLISYILFKTKIYKLILYILYKRKHKNKK